MGRARRLLSTFAGSLLALLIASGASLAAAPNAEQRGAFPVLEEPAAATVPAGVRTFVASPIGVGAGVDDGNVHRLPAPGGGYWDVLPGDGQVCLFIEADHVGACVATEQALAGYLQIISRPLVADEPAVGASAPTLAGPEVRRGLAPDGVRSVAAITADGVADDQATTAHGLFAVRAGGRVESVLLRRARGRSALHVGQRWHGVTRPKQLRPLAHAATWEYIPGPTQISGAVWQYSAGWSAGNWHNITAVSVNVQSFTTGQLCEGAQNSDGSLAGVGMCTYGSLSQAYNGSYRRGLVRAGTANAWGQGNETF